MASRGTQTSYQNLDNNQFGVFSHVVPLIVAARLGYLCENVDLIRKLGM